MGLPQDIGDTNGTSNDTNSSTDSNSTESDSNQTTTNLYNTRQDWFIAERGQYRYNFTNAWMYATAFMGGHSIGGANFTRSQYWGNFTGNISDSTASGVYDTGPWTFNNTYYRQMLLHGWGQELNINGTTNHMWKTYDYSWNQTRFARRLLQSDLCLAYEDQYNDGQFLFANNTDCCAWTEDDYLFRSGILIQARDNDYCGANIQFASDTYSQNRNWCCRNQTNSNAGDCNNPSTPQGPGIDFIRDFTYSEAWWL